MAKRLSPMGLGGRQFVLAVVACKISNMPAGPDYLGFAYFAAAKYAGYTAFCKWFIGSQLEGLSPSPQPAAPVGVFQQLGDESATLSEILQGLSLPSPWKAGAARTLTGLAIGAIVGLGFWSIPYFATHDFFAEPLFFAALVPIRIFEWWLLLAWIYRAYPVTRKRRAVIIAVGILVSFALDALGIVSAFVLPGGVWVC